MPKSHIIRETAVVRSPRVLQLEGIFDVSPSERSVESWEVNFDYPDNWNIGVIVGPSGSGKTTIANELYKDHVVDDHEWHESKSILDAFPTEMSIKEITTLLSSVGFSSPPSWIRPYRVLSTGEQFRVNIARTLAESRDLAVVDEFTSVVDRTVAQIGSAAISKTVRRRGQKFIVVTCHYDILDWLEPDWVYQPHLDKFYSGRYLHRRPEIELVVKRVHHSAWAIFGSHHYMNEKINRASYCFVAFWREVPVAFCGVLPFPHSISPGWRFHRLVCLPDYQGIGIGSVLSDYVGGIMSASGKPVRRTLAHPAVIHSANKSLNWKMTKKPGRTSRGSKRAALKRTHSTKRMVASFTYVGEKIDDPLARELWA
jgi:ABC-type ATPase involved in cell division